MFGLMVADRAAYALGSLALKAALHVGQVGSKSPLPLLGCCRCCLLLLLLVVPAEHHAGAALTTMPAK